jgi:hypothetical protein
MTKKAIPDDCHPAEETEIVLDVLEDVDKHDDVERFRNFGDRVAQSYVNIRVVQSSVFDSLWRNVVADEFELGHFVRKLGEYASGAATDITEGPSVDVLFPKQPSYLQCLPRGVGVVPAGVLQNVLSIGVPIVPHLVILRLSVDYSWPEPARL